MPNFFHIFSLNGKIVSKNSEYNQITTGLWDISVENGVLRYGSSAWYKSQNTIWSYSGEKEKAETCFKQPVLVRLTDKNVIELEKLEKNKIALLVFDCIKDFGFYSPVKILWWNYDDSTLWRNYKNMKTSELNENKENILNKIYKDSKDSLENTEEVIVYSADFIEPLSYSEYAVIGLVCLVSYILLV